jgi:hypothetical protein
MKQHLAIYLILSLLFVSTNLIASPKEELHKLKLHGVHGMVLFQFDHRFYASHLPLSHSIHAHQIMFEVHFSEAEKKKLVTIFKEHTLITIKPKAFDLNELISGRKANLSFDLYTGHFERGGILDLSNVQAKIGKPLLNNAIVNSNNGQFYRINLSPTKGLLVHKIGEHPSFDQILAIRFVSSVIHDGKRKSLVQLTSGAPFKATRVDAEDFRIVEQLYLETQDFQ